MLTGKADRVMSKSILCQDYTKVQLYGIIKVYYMKGFDIMSYKKESGIYRIYCKVNGKSYIGQSTRLRERLYQHKYYLNKNKSHHTLLQEDWNKYGQDEFEEEVLEYCDNLDEREIYYVKKFESFEVGYNTTTGGINGNKQDLRQRNMRSVRLSGKNNPMYGRNGSKNPNAKLTEETVYNIKLMLKNNKPDKSIVDKYGLTKNQFQKIKHNRAWKHIIV